jgi:hypothetical protein
MVKGISKSNAPLANWLADFTNKVANEPELLANSATSRKDITDRISEIVSGVSKNSPYNSVSEAVAGYQQKLGLNEYRKKALAQQMIGEVDDFADDVRFKEQIRVASGDDLAAKYELAGDSSICPKAQFRLANDEDDYIKQELATNPTLTDKAIEVLLRDKSEGVRAELARNVSLPSWVNDVLQNDESDAVRNAVEERDESEDDGLDIFERIRNASTRKYNKRVLAQLKTDNKVPKERRRIVYEDTPVCVGPNCKDVSKETPKQKRRIIYEDTPVCVGPNCKDVSKEDWDDHKIDDGDNDYWVKAEVATAKGDDFNTKYELAIDPQISLKAQLVLAKDDDVKIRKALATNLELADETFEVLSHDDDESVRLKLAENLLIQISPKAFEILLNDRSADVRNTLIMNQGIEEDSDDHKADDYDYDVKASGDEKTRNYGIKRDEDEEEEKYLAKLITLGEMIASIKKLPKGSDRDEIIKETIAFMEDLGISKDKLIHFIQSKGPPLEGNRPEKNDLYRNYFKSAGLMLRKRKR